MSLDEIEDIMDDTREGIEHQRVSSNYKEGNIFDLKLFLFFFIMIENRRID